MGALELLAVAVFFLIGYWVVDYLWPKKKAESAPAGPSGERVTVRVSRRLDFAPERVFDAWLDPQSAGQWLFATPSGEMVRMEIDARVGGRFNFTERRNGEDIEHSGEYLEIDRPRRLVFNFRVPKFSDEATVVRIDLAPTNFGCELTLVHEGVFANYADRTQDGWNGILDGLGNALQGNAGTTSRRFSA